MSLTQIRGQTAIKNLKLNQEKTTFQTIQMGEESNWWNLFTFLEKYFWEHQPETWLVWSIRKKNFSAKKKYLPLILLDHGNREYVAVSCCNFPHQVIFVLHFHINQKIIFCSYVSIMLCGKRIQIFTIFILYIDTVD